jgi:hypothetical protein
MLQRACNALGECVGFGDRQQARVEACFSQASITACASASHIPN